MRACTVLACTVLAGCGGASEAPAGTPAANWTTLPSFDQLAAADAVPQAAPAINPQLPSGADLVGALSNLQEYASTEQFCAAVLLDDGTVRAITAGTNPRLLEVRASGVEELGAAPTWCGEAGAFDLWQVDPAIIDTVANADIAAAQPGTWDPPTPAVTIGMVGNGPGFVTYVYTGPGQVTHHTYNLAGDTQQ